MTAFWFTGILLLLYLFHVIEKLYKIPWLKIEFVFDATWVVMYLIAASLAVSFGPEAYIAAGFFGFCAMVMYSADAVLKSFAIQRGELAQGERVINTQRTTVSSPTY
ncbi:unnamed protein product [Acanthoscelides obtectus]|nr:unnamed protein product [Acanthoscelides obtectus]CAK1662163.1 hypothetical protein AOBTE_LOCUS23018 [Acanthoscelides obtectus]